MKQDLIHEGKTWKDMPGSDEFLKKMNFSLWRKRKLSLEMLQKASKRSLKTQEKLRSQLTETTSSCEDSSSQ